MSHTMFAPHGMCMMWNQSLIWLHVTTDALVALSYYSIPAALFLVVSKKPEAIPFRRLFILFGLFIAFCGGGHLMDIVSIWKPIYWIKGYWNVGTALTSVVAAFVLIPKVTEFIQIPEATARLKREKKMLEERHGLLQSVLDSVSEGILLVGDDGGALAYNSAATALVGVSLAVQWADHAATDHQVLTRPDGKIIERSTQAIPGVGQLYVMRDITGERRANAALLDLQHVIATMKQGFATVSLETACIRSANPAMGALHGYDPDELIGLPAAALQAPAESDRNFHALSQVAERDGFWEGEVRSIRKDRSVFPSLLRVNSHQADDRKFLSFIQVDITEQKLLQAEAAAFQTKLLQSQKLESLGVLAGGVAHDFNNLLTGILGNASLALDNLDNTNAAREQMQQVMKAGERAADLTRQFLAYSGKGRFVTGPLDLSQLADETRHLVHISVPKSVQIRMNLKRPLPLVEADSAQIRQLLMNLVLNAAEAIGEEPGTVQVTTGTGHVEPRDIAAGFTADELKPGTYVFIEVQDTGCGMTDQVKRQIFDPFFTTKFKGRGLGLAATLGIVRGHGGTIKVYSVPGIGSTFKVFLPMAKEQVAAASPQEARRPLNGVGTVLVIDDEEVVRSTTRHALVHFGYRVEMAENGLRGVERFAESPASYAAVLLDLTMPVMGGEEALRRMQTIRADVPVVLTSGFNETEVVRQFAGKHLAGFLQKPFTAQQLAQAIQKAVGSPEQSE
jgi:PAS domain S-box-containing protein